MPNTNYVVEAIGYLVGGEIEITKLTHDWYPPWKTARGTIAGLKVGLGKILEIEVADLHDEQGRKIEGVPFEPNFLRVYLPGNIIRETRGWERVIYSHAYEWKMTPPRK